MKGPQSRAPGTALPVEVALSWLVCSDTLCVPERATLSANLEVGSGAPDAAGARIVAAAQRAMPRPLSGATLTREGKDWVFSSPAVARGNYRLFPEQEGWFDAAAKQTVSRNGDGVSLRIPAAGAAPGTAFRGVLSNGTKSYLVSARTVASSSTNAQPSPHRAKSPTTRCCHKRTRSHRRRRSSRLPHRKATLLHLWQHRPIRAHHGQSPPRQQA